MFTDPAKPYSGSIISSPPTSYLQLPKLMLYPYKKSFSNERYRQSRNLFPPELLGTYYLVRSSCSAYESLLMCYTDLPLRSSLGHHTRYLRSRLSSFRTITRLQPTWKGLAQQNTIPHNGRGSVADTKPQVVGQLSSSYSRRHIAPGLKSFAGSVWKLCIPFAQQYNIRFLTLLSLSSAVHAS